MAWQEGWALSCTSRSPDSCLGMTLTVKVNHVSEGCCVLSSKAAGRSAAGVHFHPEAEAG